MIDQYEILLFDADDTLFDFKSAAKEALTKSLDDFGIDQSSNDHLYEVYEEVNGQFWKKFENKEISLDYLKEYRFAHFFERIGHEGISGYEANEIFLENLIQVSRLYDDTMALLNQLNHKRKAIVTNGIKEVQRARIQNKKVAHYFEHIIISEEIGYAKPDVQFFDHTFHLFNHPKKETVLIIGDSLHSDIKGGNDYGVDTCWANWSKKENNSDIKPTYEIHNLLELIQ